MNRSHKASEDDLKIQSDEVDHLYQGIKEFRHLVLTERDVSLFRYLNEQRYMTYEQINRIFWPDKSVRAGAARQRLQKLIEAKLIKSYWLPDGNLKLFLLKQRGIEILTERKWDYGFSEIDTVSPYFVKHTLKLVDLRYLFETMNCKSWTSERLLRREKPTQGWYPDAVFETNGLKTSIELECADKATERYERKIEQYAKDKEYTLVMFVFTGKFGMFHRLYDLKMPQDKVCFVSYKDLCEKKADVELWNQTGAIKLSGIL